MSTWGSLVSSGTVFGRYAPGWLPLSKLFFAILLLFLARALYRRLGYGVEGVLFLLGHFSGVFALSECIFTLRREVLDAAGTRTTEAT